MELALGSMDTSRSWTCTVTAAMPPSYNHAFFAQDAWTIGHGLTINAGIRFEKENLPGEFDSWRASHRPVSGQSHRLRMGDKIAPRVGAAWDPFRTER